MPFSKIVLSLFFLLLIQQTSYAQNDCVDAINICGNSSYTDLSANGAGTQELSGSNSCSSEENNCLWLKINILTGGTLGFILTPDSNNINVDFDFFVFGPNATCGNIGQAIRCSTTNPQGSGSSSNTTGMNGTETDFSEGPGALGNNFVQWLTVQNNETYFIVIDRPIGTSNFSLTWTGTATFNEPPVLNSAVSGVSLNIDKCDSDAIQDSSTSFDLTTNIAPAMGNQLNLEVTFHTNPNDVLTGNNPILLPENYTNTTNPQKIYLRLTNTLTQCFTTSDFFLNVTPYQTPDPVNLSYCDLDNDGFVTFVLTENDAICSAGDPDVVVSYHPNANDTIDLPDNYTNQIPFTNEIIWAKITNTQSGCFMYKSFSLIVKTIPNVIPAQLTNCDFGLFPDGLTTFNLSAANAGLTNGNTNLVTKFYLNPADAQNDANALDTVFTNTTNPQTLSVRIIDNSTLCYAYTTLELHVSMNPTLTLTLERCDNDATEDGFAEFNLTDSGFEVNGNTVTYYQQIQDALLEENPITPQFTNTQIHQQTIYVRIENGNECIGIHRLNLFVRKLPNIDTEDGAVYCLNKPNVAITLTAGLLSGMTNSFTYLWTPNGETTPTITVLSAGIYAVRVTNSFGCFKDRTIIVNESDTAIIENIAIVDLSNNNTVTVLVIGDENQFEYSLNLPFGPFQDSNYFENVEAGIHTVYIADKQDCGIISKPIAVVGIPKFFTPNADGYNDNWKIKGLNQNFYSNSTIHIYNRFGKLLRQITPAGNGWDGSYNGIFLPADDYWYVIALEDGRVIKGHFALKR